MGFLPLHWCGRGIGVFLDEPGFLRDHVWDATNDGIGDTELLIDQLIGFSLVSGERQEPHHSSTTNTSLQSQSFIYFN